MFENLTLQKERYVSSAFIDSSLKMGIAQSVLMVQDNLTECFSHLGCDGITYRERHNAFCMNNIEYIRLALNVFSDDFLQQNQVQTLEVHYLGESKENQTLRVYSKTTGTTFFVYIKEQNRLVFEMMINFH